MVKDESFTNEDFYKISDTINSNLRILKYYSQQNKEKRKAPKGYSRKMLCWTIIKLLDLNMINLNRFI
jgi:hypothetical protein